MREDIDQFIVGLTDDEAEDFLVILRAGVKVIESVYDSGAADILINVSLMRDLSELLEEW